MTKRLFDIVAAATALCLFLPIMIVTAVAVALTMGRPVLFRQRRAGQHGQEFELFKFRSMRDAVDPDGLPLPDDVRTTPLGLFLRRSRLDELPELLLVLSGHMSFVGPRPLPVALLEQADVLHRRSQSRPGLTGLAQVSGNTQLNPQEKFAIDIYYNDHRSLAGDVRILFATLRTVFAGEKRDGRLILRAMNYENTPYRRSR